MVGALYGFDHKAIQYKAWAGEVQDHLFFIGFSRRDACSHRNLESFQCEVKAGEISI